MDNLKIRLIECFGGIGACTKALKRLNINTEVVDYVEIDKYAVASYNAINGTNFKPQDITKWDKDYKDIDLICGGFPCQDVSIAGKQAGIVKGKTRSGLMYELLRVIEKLKPRYTIAENVKNLLSKKHKDKLDEYIREMDRIGYHTQYDVLNAKDYGIPQNRERVFVVSIRKDLHQDFTFPPKIKLTKFLQDMLEKEVDDKYFLSDKYLENVDEDKIIHVKVVEDGGNDE